jgi:DNA-binding GntR family transcriptional regulator
MSEPRGLGPVNVESTASIIARRLRRAIMYGLLPPGTQLTETELAAQFGVSRGPLREAMQRLVQEGLLRSERNRGLFVITLTPDDVRDIYRARAVVERAAVSLILHRDPGQAAVRLGAVVKEMQDAAARGDQPALYDADLRFHEVLVAESGSPRLMRMHGTLLVEARMCMTALSTYRAADALVEEHARLVEGIRAGDEARLSQLIDAHMEVGTQMERALRRLTTRSTTHPPDFDDQAEGARPPAAPRRPRRARPGPATG